MLTIALLLCLLIWSLVIICQIRRHSLLILTIWLIVAPIASNIFVNPYRNPLFKLAPPQSIHTASELHGSGYLADPEANIGLRDLIEPTRIVFGLIFFTLIFDVLLRRREPLSLNSTEVWMSLLSILLLVSSLLQSRRLLFSIRVTFDAFIVPFISYFIARRLIAVEASLHKIMRLIGYVSIYVILLSLIEYILHQRVVHRLSGPLTPNSLNIIMTLAFFIGLLDSFYIDKYHKYYSLFPREIRHFILYLAPIILLLTWTRGNWVGFLLSLGTFVLLAHRLLNFKSITAVIGSILIAIPVIFTIVQAILPGTVVEARLGTVSSIYSRLGAWQVMLEQFSTAPIFGIGLNNLRDVLAETRIFFEDVKSETHAHNSFLSILVELGVVGLLTYLAVIGSIIRMGFRLYHRSIDPQDQWQGLVVVAIMLGYLVPSFFANVVYSTYSLTHVYVYVFVGGVSGLYRRNLS